ncbi:MAG: carbohydrate ABC transporter substrate-binding protein, partial [Cellulomonadaceae bacterium]|nr:carbohydrate ABC transporter substrate-binding protein [Cellulomonadaceae bacterium]
MSVSTSKVVQLGVGLAGVSLLLTGCLSDSGSDNSSGGGGGTVEIVGAFSGTQQEGFEADIAKISEATGIDITYTSTDQFEVVIQSRVEGGNVPDIAIYPQVGLLKDMVASGDIVSLADAGVDVDAAVAAAIPGLPDIATKDDVLYGLPYSMNAKSLVWYPSPEFEDAGYTDPTTHAELVALSDQIKADGTTPWCFGVDAGWPGTDWLEEYVLREGGPDVYDQWVNHEIPFNDPIIKKAAQDVADLLLADGNVYGGPQAVAATTFDVAANPLFTDPPGCFLHRQGNFITSFFPEDVQADLTANTNLFLLPPVEGGFDGQPILGGGDFMALFDTENADAATVLEAIASPDFGENSAKTGAWLSPYVDFDTSLYANDTLSQIASLVSTADTFRFDGSDSMPGEVGNGTFWTGMVEWLSGQKDIDTVL